MRQGTDLLVAELEEQLFFGLGLRFGVLLFHVEVGVEVHARTRGDDAGAFVAFLEAAEAGHPPAQRKLGEIYDSGNTAVERNYLAAIHWYEKAREGGEVLPPLRSPYPTFIYLP